MAFAKLGYHILLEKPMAPTAAACRRIVAEVRKYGKTFAVCHVLRYTTYTRAVKALVDSGRIGDIVSVEHLEPVGFWHQAHSFVRGNWRNEKESSFMLLAKSCHDVDWLSYIVGRRCLRVSSFGSLYYFKPENRPEGAADRCMDCALSKKCPYSAKEFYFRKLRNYDFLTRKTETIDTKASDADMAGGHGGGDGGLLKAFCRAIVENRPELIVSGSDATIESHLTTFAAEKARRTGRVVEMAKFKVGAHRV